MININPIINPSKIHLLEYFLASSNISFILIVIIIPETNNNITPIIVLDINLYKNKYDKSAPIGSDNPLNNVFLNALYFEPVE
jgi:hypothetical protein